MKLAVPALLVSLCLPSCILSIGDGIDTWDDTTTFTSRADEVRRENRRNLDQLRLGMDRQQVDEILGTESKWVSNSIGWVDNPYRTSAFRDTAGREIAVRYYYTDVRSRDDVITDDELTPVVFADGEVIGWGQSFDIPKAAGSGSAHD